MDDNKTPKNNESTTKPTKRTKLSETKRFQHTSKELTCKCNNEDDKIFCIIL